MSKENAIDRSPFILHNRAVREYRTPRNSLTIEIEVIDKEEPIFIDYTGIKFGDLKKDLGAQGTNFFLEIKRDNDLGKVVVKRNGDIIDTRKSYNGFLAKLRST